MDEAVQSAAEEVMETAVDDNTAEEFLPSDVVADLVEYLVVNLVDDVDAIAIDVTDSENSSLIEVTLAPEDIGKVIGRHGRVIKAIRTLANAAATRNEINVNVEVLG